MPSLDVQPIVGSPHLIDRAWTLLPPGLPVKAFEVARVAHEGKWWRNGDCPLIFFPVRVSLELQGPPFFIDDPMVLAATLLFRTVGEGHATPMDLMRHFPPPVVGTVNDLTHPSSSIRGQAHL